MLLVQEYDAALVFGGRMEELKRVAHEAVERYLRDVHNRLPVPWHHRTGYVRH